jgi:GT2 family glycosyltransferase/glycosyltransferase involved in cell wall biosynthesis/polysaccharide pyruvyl transferase WcaK-like protein
LIPVGSRMNVERIILIPPAAPGSKGDEGMLRGALTLLADLPIVVLNPEVGASWCDSLNKEARLTEVMGPIRDFQNELRPGDLILAIGADVIDGTCGLDPAFTRLDLMSEALRLGLPTLVTCSFRSRVDPAILQAICLLPGIRFLIRDLHSLENFRRQTGLPAEFFPDLSFFKGAIDSPLAEPVRADIAKARAGQRPIIGVNFAEHSFRSFNDIHNLDQRRLFVDTVMAALHQGHPEAFFVLFSNDSRSWDNHPSDASYNHLASHWICINLGSERHVNLPDDWGYGLNIAILKDVDFIVTGRMHLSLAAFQVETVPFVLMGEGKDYSSADKMRGAFANNMGTTKAVITDLSTISSCIAEVLAERQIIAMEMAEAVVRRAEDCARGHNTIDQILAVDAFEARPEAPALARIDAYKVIRKQANLLQAAEAALSELRESGRRGGTISEKEYESFDQALRSQAEALQAAEEKAARSEQAAKILSAGGDRMAEELRKTAARPWRPLKRGIQRGFLKLVLLFGWAMSDARFIKTRRSLAKRKPRHAVLTWEGVKAEAWSNAPPVDPLLSIALPRPPIAKVLKYRCLLALATLSEPLSKNRARRFRRSAEKRNPFHLSFDPLAKDIRPLSTESGFLRLDPARQRRILVADYRIPRPDVSAGERATFGIISDLCALGFDVTFLSTDMLDDTPYREALEALEVKVVTTASGYNSAADYVRANGDRFGVFYLIRVDVAEKLHASARVTAPDARVIFHAPDLYHLREMREAMHVGDPAAHAKAEKTRSREAAIMQAVDHVVLVSPAELPFLTEIVPERRISVFPALYSAVIAEPPGFAGRSGLFFLGGFKHRPNIDAVIWFVDKIWPRIHAARPDLTFDILGAEAPSQVIALGNRPGVRFVGFVADLDPVMVRYRLSVVPLRYGAGIKGKVGTAMGAGVPCVITQIGAEGMNIVDGRHALVSDSAEGFAEAVLALYDNQAMWERISAEGRRLVEDRFGLSANRSSLYRTLSDAKALPLDAYVAACKQSPACALPVPDASEAVDVSIIIPVHNKWAFTRDCLVSVEKAIQGSGLNCEVILADDASSDETLTAADIFPGLRVVRQEQSLGFLRNCNAAAAEARGEALVFLNNDTIVLPGWITAMVRIMRQEPSVGIVGSKLLYPDGSIQEIGAILFTDSSAGNIGRGKPRYDPLFSFDREVDYVTGASILVQRSLWEELGGFDELYAPAYCEDSDLAMAARDRGLRVICAAGSEVVHFEHGTYGEVSAAAPKALALANGNKLREKWASQFEADHLPSGTQIEIAAAHAERRAFAPALARRATGKLNILYFSPFPSHPDNHGNQATIQSFGRRFQKMGHKVHFALLQSSMYTSDTCAEMRATWDSFTILPNSYPLHAKGDAIPFDSWYQPGLGEDIRILCEENEIDVVFCSYIFQSKLLDFVPAHVLKVIDTHDKMGDRYKMLRQKGQPLEFFSCSLEEEGRYLRRADVVVARRAEEASYFNSVTGRQSAIVIPHVEEARFMNRDFGPVCTVGMVASANRINLAITLELLKALANREQNGTLPFSLHIAGQVSDMINNLPREEAALFSRTWVRFLGFVPDIESFYGSVDVVVSPITMGTGINVKTVQAMAFGMPLITTAWGSKGIETDHPMHAHADVEALIDGLFRVADDAEALNDLARVSRERYTRFLVESDATIEDLFGRVRFET